MNNLTCVNAQTIPLSAFIYSVVANLVIPTSAII
jgi:hypothetical protein